VAAHNASVKPHAAEIADDDHVVCWLHFDSVADLTVPAFARSTAR
jgi:hypothetical protein